MKRGKLIAIITALSAACVPAQAGLILTGIYDGDTSDPKGIELFVTSTGNYNGWSVELQTNAGTTWSSGYTFDTTSYNAGDFLYITSTDSTLTSWGWDARGAVIADGSFNQNGNDRFRIVNDSASVIDMYGVDGVDGTGQAWEYTDSYAVRTSGTGPTATFNISDWIIQAPNSLDGAGAGQQATLTAAFGVYAVPEPSTYAMIFGVVAIGFAVYRRRKAA